MDDGLQQKAFLLLLGLVTLAFFWIVLPFYGAVFWAIILAIVFNPLQRALERLFGGRRSAAAGVSLLVCVVIAVLPVTLIAASLLAQATQLIVWIQTGAVVVPASLTELYDDLPHWAQTALESVGVADLDTLRARIAAAVLAVTQFVASQAVNVGQNTLRFFVSLGVMLYVLFFLFRDGPQIGRSLRAAMPLSDVYSRRLLDKFATVVRATVKGNIIIAVIQGGIGGAAFWLLGIPGALLWGVLMMFLSLLPAVGAAIVWAPVAVYLILIGDTLRGGALAFVGVAVIGVVDNLLRPPLVGKDTKLPDYVVLVSTIGGLSLFGINGFVIGPLIAALFVACWTIFREVKAARAAEAPL